MDLRDQDLQELKLNKLTSVAEDNPIITNSSLSKEDNLRRKYSKGMDSSYFEKMESFAEKNHIGKSQELNVKVKSLFDEVSPLIYLNKSQKEIILKNIFYIGTHVEEHVIYQHSESKFSKNNNNKNKLTIDNRYNGNNCYILISGEIHAFDQNENYKEAITVPTFFGYSGPLFNKRNFTLIAQKDTVIGVLSREVFLEFIQPFSQFSSYIQRVIIHRDKYLDALNTFKTFILGMADKGPIEIQKLLSLYKEINSCLHPGLHQHEVDYNAWSYAINRLPNNLFDTFCFVLMNKIPKLCSADEELNNELMPKIPCATRHRDIFRSLNGKTVIVCREMETDVLDFVANMCIHMVESQKMRKYVNTPSLIKTLFHSKDLKETIKALEDFYEKPMKSEDKTVITNIWGDKFKDMLIKLCLHYQDYSIKIQKVVFNDRDPVENWIQNLWKRTRSVLGVQSSIDEIDDLVVDLMQGSKKTLLYCISPHMYMIKDEILKWGKEQNIQLKTKKFLNENDIVIAYSFYYYKAHPEKLEEKIKLDKEHGIEVIKETFATGVQILLINVNKLNSKFIDPSLKLKPASKNHLILHIGYTFGAQSGLIIKPVLMLFGSKARSFNVIGKAGGLSGNRTDILVADKMFYDKTHDLIPIQTGDINVDQLKKSTHSCIHVGPMLCVAGTLFQNDDLLQFYKNVNGCVGLEMEGYFFVQEIDKFMKNGTLSKSFLTRCFYYASDLPLDPTQNLSMETGNISWDEGVGSMIAIQRYILSQMFNN